MIDVRGLATAAITAHLVPEVVRDQKKHIPGWWRHLGWRNGALIVKVFTAVNIAKTESRKRDPRSSMAFSCGET